LPPWCRESLTFLEALARHGGSPRRRLKPGTVLVRDYHGRRHSVTVAPDGFNWQGTTYASLSAIARAITGTAWSGPRFFALRPNGTSPRSNHRKSVRGGRIGSHIRQVRDDVLGLICDGNMLRPDLLYLIRHPRPLGKPMTRRELITLVGGVAAAVPARPRAAKQ
jgi:hypothetical protein